MMGSSREVLVAIEYLEKSAESAEQAVLRKLREAKERELAEKTKPAEA